MDGGKNMGYRKFSQLIMLEQTLFALPFAYLGVLFAGGGTATTWIWVTVALVAARAAGMSFNRAIDADIDSKNPRTRERLVPRGEVRRQTAWLVGIIGALVLVGASYMLNELCFYLSFPAVIMLYTYSYFKRFSASSHFYLGFVEAAAPIGGYLAVSGEFTWTPLVLGFVIMTWIAGLDIVYALQDMDFDAREKLHSIPVVVGREGALAISAGCYVLAVGALVLAGLRADMTVPYWLAVAGTAMIFVYQQKLARSDRQSVAIGKFFRANMYVSPTLLCGTAIAVALW